jgi:hypothetical protein
VRALALALQCACACVPAAKRSVPLCQPSSQLGPTLTLLALRAADNSDDVDVSLRRALRIVMWLQEDHVVRAATAGPDLPALDPTRALESLSKHIGSSVETHNRTAAIIEAEFPVRKAKGWDPGPRVAALAVLLASVAHLPANSPEYSTEESPSKVRDAAQAWTPLQLRKG